MINYPVEKQLTAEQVVSITSGKSQWQKFGAAIRFHRQEQRKGKFACMFAYSIALSSLILLKTTA